MFPFYLFVGMLHKAANVAIAKALEEMKAAITIYGSVLPIQIAT